MLATAARAASEIQSRMFANIRLRGQDTLARLLDVSTEEADQELRTLASCQLARQLELKTIDANQDGLITVAEILAHETDNASPLGDFIRFVRQEMAFGQGRESHDDVYIDGRIITGDGF